MIHPCQPCSSRQRLNPGLCTLPSPRGAGQKHLQQLGLQQGPCRRRWLWAVLSHSTQSVRASVQANHHAEQQPTYGVGADGWLPFHASSQTEQSELSVCPQATQRTSWTSCRSLPSASSTPTGVAVEKAGRGKVTTASPSAPNGRVPVCAYLLQPVFGGKLGGACYISRSCRFRGTGRRCTCLRCAASRPCLGVNQRLWLFPRRFPCGRIVVVRFSGSRVDSGRPIRRPASRGRGVLRWRRRLNKPFWLIPSRLARHSIVVVRAARGGIQGTRPVAHGVGRGGGRAQLAPHTRVRVQDATNAQTCAGSA